MKILILCLLLLILPGVVLGQGVEASRERKTTFANLATPSDSNVRYCSDCAATSPCTGSGTGAFASRVNGAWNCSSGGSAAAGGSNTQVQYNNSGAFGGISGATTNGTKLILVGPDLGTPASGVATNLTGLPVSTGLTGAGTGALTAFGVNVGSVGAFVVNGGAGGTPSSLTLTSATGLPLTTGVTGVLPVANGGSNCSVASITCFNNITGFSAAGTTGTTSTNLVFSTSPTFITPALGVASATSLTFAATANSSVLSASGYSLTGSDASAFLTMTGTWNTSGNPTLLFANVTNTAAGATAKFLDFQLGGSTQFNISKFGNVTVAGGIFGASGVEIRNDQLYAFSSTSSSSGSVDTNVNRASAGLVNIGTTAANALGSLAFAAFTASGATQTLSNAAFTTCAGLSTTANVLGCVVSDERKKQNFLSFTKGLNAISALVPQSYQFRPETKYYGKGERHTSLVAQNVRSVIPEAVSDIGDGTLQIDPATIQAVMVNAIKELKARVEILERQKKMRQRHQ